MQLSSINEEDVTMVGVAGKQKYTKFDDEPSG